MTYVEPKETMADGFENVSGHHTVGGGLVSRFLVIESGHRSN
jgi:hypothetical protein